MSEREPQPLTVTPHAGGARPPLGSGGPSRSESAAGTIRDALIVLSGHLPLFSADKRRVARAEQHLALRAEAFDALDVLCDQVGVPRVVRRMNAA